MNFVLHCVFSASYCLFRQKTALTGIATTTTKKHAGTVKMSKQKKIACYLQQEMFLILNQPKPIAYNSSQA